MAQDMAVKFSELCTVFERISETKKRLEIQGILTAFFKRVIADDPASLTAVLYLCTGTFAPAYHNKELGIGEGILLRVISEASNKTVKSVREEYKAVGDLGTIAAKCRSTQLVVFKKKDLTVAHIHHELIRINGEEGTKSQNAKLRRMLGLLSHTLGVETKYLVRIFEAKLKIGLALKTVLISLSYATSPDTEDHSESVKLAYNCQPAFETIVPLLLEFGSLDIHRHVDIQPGVPLKPMLAHPTKNITSAFKRFEGDVFTCEYKYDGERAQIHKCKDAFRVYSRNSEDLTEKYPELSHTLRDVAKGDADFVLDCEVVAFDSVQNKILPFQTLSTRKRKNVEVKDITVGVCVFVFDILYFGESSTIPLKLGERRKVIMDNFVEVGSVFRFVTFMDCTSVDEIEALFSSSIHDNCEGLMIKSLGKNSEYTPSKRCYSWIKLKKDYISGMSDTLDLVVLGCYYGKGKRAGTYGGFLMGCYDDENGVFQTICKLGTGFSEENLAELHKRLQASIVECPQDIVGSEAVEPDLWLAPKHVWEVQAAGFSLSPIYSAGRATPDAKGLSLRFPRFVRERCDKDVTDATSSSQVMAMYNAMSDDEVDSDDY